MANNDSERKINSMEQKRNIFLPFLFPFLFFLKNHIYVLRTISSNILYKFTVQMAILSIYKSELLRDLLWIKDFK